MEIRLQISDAAYQRLVSTGSRMQGTIGLVNSTEGNFNEHMRRPAPKDERYIRLPHGRVCVDKHRARLVLRVDFDETDIIPAQAITDEANEASDFVENFADCFGW